MSSPERPIDLLVVLPSLRPGGAEIHTLRLLEHFDTTRIRPRLALHYGGGGLEARLPETLEWSSLCAGRPRSALLRALRSVTPLRRLLRQKPPDVVLAIQELSGIAVALAAPQMPWALAVQNTLSAKREQRQGPASWLFFRGMLRALQRAGSVVAASRGVAEDLQGLLGSLAAPMEVIYNAGFDPLPTGATHSALPDDAAQPPGPLLVACGRLVPQKDPSTLLRAFHLLARPEVSLWIVGEGPERPRIERQIQDLGLTSQVWLAGHRPDPRPFLARADLLVSSSLYEGFGNVLVEAMACGTPVLATDCPHGPGELVEPGVSGRLVPVADPSALAEAMAQLLDDPAALRHLATGARIRAEAFHPRRAAESYQRHLTALVRGLSSLSRTES